jgi:pimeloyl-ACP methyl ester carboxylesterase
MVKINYAKEGKGILLMFLHGFCEDLSMWDEFSECFSKDYCVMRLDFPGFGASEPMEKVSVETMADIINSILINENRDKVCLVGHSMGGYVAMAFAEKYGEKLSGLCLFHSHPFEDSEEKKENRRKTILFIEKWGSETFVKEFIPKLFTADFIETNREFTENFTEKALRNSKAGILAATDAMINRKDRSDVLRSLKCPKLIIIGEQDEIISDSINSQLLTFKEQAQIKKLNCGHMGMFELKNECLTILNAFFDSLNPFNADN